MVAGRLVPGHFVAVDDRLYRILSCILADVGARKALVDIARRQLKLRRTDREAKVLVVCPRVHIAVVMRPWRGRGILRPWHDRRRGKRRVRVRRDKLAAAPRMLNTRGVSFFVFFDHDHD